MPLDVGNALYSTYIYQLFLLNFIDYARSIINVEIRKKIVDFITGSTFEKAAIRKFIIGLEIGDADKRILYKQFMHGDVLTSIESTRYEFDNIIINKLSILPIDRIRAELETLVTHFAIVGDIGTITFPNVYESCNKTNADFCQNGRLIMSQADLDAYTNILSGDIANEIKIRHIMRTIAINSVIDYLKFDKNNETIDIYEL